MMIVRPRRLRSEPALRDMVSEVRLSENIFIYPYFVVPGNNIKAPIEALPDVYHFSIDLLLKDIEECLKVGLNKFILFGVGESKSAEGHSACAHDSIVAQAIKAIKKEFGSKVYLITDVCLCAYTTHGHCGIVKNGKVINDETLSLIGKMSLSHVQAGADMVAPSGMMDGAIAAIRRALDSAGFIDTPIMSYSVKYASAYYGPFREAADSAPQGDRKSYQMDFRNKKEALIEAELDEDEGADILMVKPALAYLDIISDLKNSSNRPIACYNVSGEYSMVKAAAKNGWVDEQKIVMENMYAFVRAGASIIITYHAKDILSQKWL